jgi:transglutaminase-like putative cysteine protease
MWRGDDAFVRCGAARGAGFPLRGQIADIRAATSDPMAQAAMALTIARRDVRYLYVGLGQGNLKPMPADQVWLRGFADCKGKTALLLGLLDGLGIKAEAALVSTQEGEAMDRRLPSVTGFDHVIVRAQLAGRIYWLDPTAEMAAKDGAIDLAAMPVPRYGWALPLRIGAGLEAVGGARSAEPRRVRKGT